MTGFTRKEENRKKLFCTFDGCENYFYAKWHLDRHIRKHNGEVNRLRYILEILYFIIF